MTKQVKDSLGNRMKDYENVSRNFLTKKVPVIIRIDGRAFHTLTRNENFEKPFSDYFHENMLIICENLFKEIQNVKLIYTQSDEISILMIDDDKPETESWFGNNINKIVSISTSLATCIFNKRYVDETGKPKKHFIMFDSRAFNIPYEEIDNYFIWRQKDWFRNSVNMLGQHYFSHKELQKKNHSDVHEMLHGIGINWADLESWKKNGSTYYKTSYGFNLTDEIIFKYGFFSQLMNLERDSND